ncbi:MAG: aminoacyl-histidine dipeptidase [Firmicutes bacterium]|nr:aminoacyl-histidine dipeptidase [Bacillota bacterium]
MSKVLKDLEPKKVFEFFEELTKIPRCSGNEKKVSDYLVNFAKERNLEVIQDEALNIVIKKPATKGYENAKRVILQGHMDMVCEKNKDTKHDFSKDPLNLRIKDELLMATGTTLGADNGIAVAYCLALLDSNDIPHPPLEVLVTTEEETGMGGAQKLDPDSVNGDILINIDSEEEGVFLVSCAGGVRTKAKLPIEWTNKDENKNSYTIKIRGLKGGHSGMEINKGRGNSNKIMGRILYNLNGCLEFDLAEVNGGAKMNAIPREADAIVLVDKENKEKLINEIGKWDNILKNELKAADPNVSVVVDECKKEVKKTFNKITKESIISLYNLIPNGIETMSMEIKGLVESSTNLGVVTTYKNEIVLESATRSSIESLKSRIVEKTSLAAKVTGAEFVTNDPYPAWQYNSESKIRDLFVKVYKEKFGVKPEITAIHAGLECGLFREKLGDLDMISLGPDMHDVHTPDENLSISSTKKTWEFLLDVLKEIK